MSGSAASEDDVLCDLKGRAGVFRFIQNFILGWIRTEAWSADFLQRSRRPKGKMEEIRQPSRNWKRFSFVRAFSRVHLFSTFLLAERLKYSPRNKEIKIVLCVNQTQVFSGPPCSIGPRDEKTSNWHGTGMTFSPFLKFRIVGSEFVRFLHLHCL